MPVRQRSRGAALERPISTREPLDANANALPFDNTLFASRPSHRNHAMNADAPKRDRDDAPHDDETADRDAILQRRRLFVTSAVATMMLASCERFTTPQPCLDMPPPADSGIPITVPACLTPVAPDVEEFHEGDASAADTGDSSSPAASPDAGVASAAARSTRAPHSFRPCLSAPIRRDVRPTVCLFLKPTSDDDSDD